MSLKPHSCGICGVHTHKHQTVDERHIYTQPSQEPQVALRLEGSAPGGVDPAGAAIPLQHLLVLFPFESFGQEARPCAVLTDINNWSKDAPRQHTRSPKAS